MSHCSAAELRSNHSLSVPLPPWMRIGRQILGVSSLSYFCTLLSGAVGRHLFFIMTVGRTKLIGATRAPAELLTPTEFCGGYRRFGTVRVELRLGTPLILLMFVPMKSLAFTPNWETRTAHLTGWTGRIETEAACIGSERTLDSIRSALIHGSRNCLRN